jgi:signal transduction histidine kinase
MSAAIEKQGHRAFILLGLISVLLSSAMMLAVIRFRAYSHDFGNTHGGLTAIVALEASVTHAESSVRAYLVTADETFLDEFAQQKEETRADAKRLQQLLSDSDQEKSQIAALTAAVSRRTDFLTEVAALRKAGVDVLCINVEYAGEGKRLAAEISNMIKAAKADQERLLAERRVGRHQIEVAVLTLCGIGAGFSIALVVVGLRAMRKDLRLRTQAQEELSRTNAELEQRVLDRTASIQRANAELQRSQAEISAIANDLERSNVELESFAYAATHDLQEPLRTVTLYAQLLQKQGGISASSQEAERYLKTIIGAVDRMSELIQGLLEYSRVSREPLESSAPVDLNEVIHLVEENLSAQIKESGAEITRSALPIVNGTHLQLIRLLQNLIGNSLKYRSVTRPCRIEIHAERAGQYWALSVRDNGVGFKTEYEQYIFGMFKRLDRGRAGAGVGLATCRSIVDRNGGAIWAEGRDGQGATFHFTWPVAQNEERGRRARCASASPNDANHVIHEVIVARSFLSDADKARPTL